MGWLIGIGVFVFLLMAVAAFVATRPDDLHVERSAKVDAPPDAVFAIFNDLSRWREWSPYERDPNMKTTLDGPPSGPGASYAWDGNGEVGAGRMTIVETRPGELVAVKLEFLRPFKCVNQVQFKVEPLDGGSRASWIMDGKYNIVTKAMCLFMDMDKMIGDDFEAGLANLDRVASRVAV